jgi:hypothetical protein
MDSQTLPLQAGEQLLGEIPTSPRTVLYYSLRAAPLFGFWYVGLLAFLIYSFKLEQGSPIIFLAVALGLSGAVYLIGTILQWMWRVDISQRDAWVSTHGIWLETPDMKGKFFPFSGFISIKEKKDWMGKWLHLEGIEILYRENSQQKKLFIAGVENGEAMVQELNARMHAVAQNVTASM